MNSFEYTQQSRRAARADLEKSGELKDLCRELHDHLTDLAASPRWRNDDAQEMLNRIFDDVLPEYRVRAERMAENAAPVLNYGRDQ